MPSPFHQKYATQSHKAFSSSSTQPEPPRRASIASTSSETSSTPPESPTQRRKSSSGLFANLYAMKRPDDPEHTTRRASITDSKIGTPGYFGKLWNNYVHGPGTPQQQPDKMTNIKPKEERDTTTLRFE